MNNLIKQHREDGVLTLTFNRPDKLNALNNAMYLQLADLLQSADEDAAIGVIILTGGDLCFTSGNDLADFLEHPPTDLSSPAFQLMHVVIHLTKPLIAAVCGPAIGIGTTLLLHCDQVLVTQNAKLRMPFVNLGLCPEFGASLLLPRLIGHTRAASLLLWGDSLEGAAAVACGLANEVFDDGAQCLTAARRVAQRLLAMPGECLRLTRKLLKQPMMAELLATVRQENMLFIERLNSLEAQTALKAIIKRSDENSSLRGTPS